MSSVLNRVSTVNPESRQDTYAVLIPGQPGISFGAASYGVAAGFCHAINLDPETHIYRRVGVEEGEQLDLEAALAQGYKAAKARHGILRGSHS